MTDVKICPSNSSADEQIIFALASGTGRAAVAIVRISGPGCGAELQALCGPLPPPRYATLRKLRGSGDEILDQALVLWFPGPASYTGEDVLELQVHGSRAVVAAVCETLVSLGARPAEPGEFTRRAFLNGKIDLVQAEGVADLVDAQTTAQRRQALRQLDGGLSEIYHNWASRLRHVLAWQEALIDFVTEDLPSEIESDLLLEVEALRFEIGRHLDDRRRGEIIRDGLTFVIAGHPNAGKSSLINILGRKEVAIVAPTPGTTRDAIEVRIDLGGILVTLIDTAGIRRSDDPIEIEGVRRARQHIEAADLVIHVNDTSAPAEQDDFLECKAPRLMVLNKIDIRDLPSEAIKVSALTGVGIEGLRRELERRAVTLASSNDAPPLTRARHRVALVDALNALSAARDSVYSDLRGEELRVALQCIGRITGLITPEQLLDTIFHEFCIGK